MASAPPAAQQLELSSNPAFSDDPSLLNPEQLVVLAAASCQLLSFLAVVARARIDVLHYEDEAVGVMPEKDLPIRLISISLRPTIHVAAGTSVDRVKYLMEIAHRECSVANSLRTEIVITPNVIIGASSVV